MPTLEQIAGSPEAIMGVKAVFGRSEAAVMCFGSHGDEAAKDRGHFSLARSVAEAAMERPWLISIGGGDDVPPDLRGRVLELIRVTGVFGETKAFIHDASYLARLARWPVAVVISEVYAISGEPLLIEDLNFPNRKILANAYDGIRRDEGEILRLWEALRECDVHRRSEIQLPAGFRDPGKVELYSTMYPRVVASSTEGKKIWKEQLVTERGSKLGKEAKKQNRILSGGMLRCETCDFSHEQNGAFDAHHLFPLACGVRETRIDDFAILCPTCHRLAHVLGIDKLQPLPINALKSLRSP